MQLPLNSVKRAYLALALFYYMGFLNFFIRLIGGDARKGDAFSANASGSLSKQLLGVTLLGVGIYLLMRIDRRVLLQTLRENLWWLLLLAFFAASVYWSYTPAVTFRRVIAFATLMVAAYCIVTLFDPISLLTLISRAIVLAAFCGLIYAVIDPANGLTDGDLRSKALLGILGDKNGGARCYTYGILLMVGLGHYRLWRHKLMLALLLFCILISQSATAVVMLVAGLAMVVLFRELHSRRVQVNFSRFVLICVLFALGATAAYYLYDFLLGLLGRDPTLTNRLIIWELMDQYIDAEPWLGYGFGAYWASSAVESFIERWGYIGNAHSGYYEALLHGGRVALVLIALVLFKTLKDLISVYIHHPNGALFAPLIPIVILQIVVNYVAFVIINHNSFDMFLFAVISFAGAYQVWRLRQRKTIAAPNPLATPLRRLA